MKNADLPINPQPVCGDGRAWLKSDLGYDMQVIGLTKREHFAAMAMQGLCANSCENSPAGLWDVVAADAVKAADSLLKALESQP